VFDNHDREPLLVEAVDPGHHLLGLGSDEARQRLIEDQEFRIARQGDSNGHDFLEPVREIAGRFVGLALQMEDLDDSLRLGLDSLVFFPIRTGPQDRFPEADLGRGANPQGNVIEHGEIEEEGGELKGSTDAFAGDEVGPKTRDVLSPVEDGTGSGGVESGNDIHHHGLAGPVGTDQAQKLARADREIDAIQGDQPREVFDDPFDLQQLSVSPTQGAPPDFPLHKPRQRAGVETSPPGRRRITRMMMSP
jgi:hypothetical protein